MRVPRILMCPPDFFGIEYEINPWMSRHRGAAPDRARLQWQQLHATLVSLGVTVEMMQPQQGLPDLVFTANAGVVYEKRFFSSRFRHEVRARETPHFDAWFADHGYTVEHLPEGTYFEGAGDALFCGDILFAGYRIRSDVRGHQNLGEAIGCRVLPMELVDPRFYHLDTCFCPIAPGYAIWFPGAFDRYGRKVIETHIPYRIEVAEDEAVRFACNAVVIGKTVVMNAGSDKLAAALGEWGYAVRFCELDEFIKSGGSAKCLTIRLDGEDAAAWSSRSA
ncbi:MAG: arginine deiminase-related protein [Gemmataceae bacterium]